MGHRNVLDRIRAVAGRRSRAGQAPPGRAVESRLPASFQDGLRHHSRSVECRRALDYDQAIAEGRRSLNCLRACEEALAARRGSPGPHGGLAPLEIVQDAAAAVLSELAAIMAESGNLSGALRLTDELLRSAGAAMTPARLAAALNADAQVRLSLGDMKGAEASLQRAEEAADKVGLSLLRGQTLLTRAVFNRLQVNAPGRRPLPGAEAIFEHGAVLLRGDPDGLRALAHERARFLRGLADHHHLSGNGAAAMSCRQAALRSIEEALGAVPDRAPPLLRASLVQTRASVLVSLGRRRDAHDELARLDALLAQPMPPYAQLLCGKQSLLLARLALTRPRPDYPAALRHLALAVARAQAFGPRHREQETIEQHARALACEAVPTEELSRFKRQLTYETVTVHIQQLRHQTHNLTSQRWSAAWERAIQLFIGLPQPAAAPRAEARRLGLASGPLYKLPGKSSCHTEGTLAAEFDSDDAGGIV